MKNRLKSSIHEAKFIELKASEEREKVLPWHYSGQDIDRQQEARDYNKIEDVLALGETKVLLLGAPGSGKTTTLLNLADIFREKAEQDEQAKIPVLFNLSLWGQAEQETARNTNWYRKFARNSPLQRQNPELKDWLIDRMARLPGAGISIDMATQWIETNEVCLLLDGLDEAQESLRGKLLRELNAFLKEHVGMTVIVCSRSADYEALVETTSTQLRLDIAVTIHPLNTYQIDEYLTAAKADRLREVLKTDTELLEMAKTPLELSLMVLAYGDEDFEVRQGDQLSQTARRMHLFESFVSGMMQRKARRDKGERDEINLRSKKRLKTPYSVKQMNRYLGWLAKRMSERSRSSVNMSRLYEFLWEYDKHRLFSMPHLVHSIFVFFCTSLIFIAADIPDVSPESIAKNLAIGLGGGAFYFYLFFNVQEFDQRDEPFENPFSRSSLALLLPFWLAALPVFAFLFGGLDYWLPWPATGWIIFSLVVVLVLLIFGSDGDGDSGSLIRAYAASIFLIIIFICALLFLHRPSAGSSFFISILLFLWLLMLEVSNNDSDEKLQISYIVFLLISALVAGLFFFNQPTVLTAGLIACLGFIIIFIIGKKERQPHTTFTKVIICWLAVMAGIWVHPILAIGLGIWAFIGSKKVGEGPGKTIGSYLANRLINIIITIRRYLPFRRQFFIRYCVDTFLLKESYGEFEFIHRRLRDYFAIREVYSKLTGSDQVQREQMTRELSKLRDASCDVLLELVNDDDKNIRLACVAGLGQIGSAIAAQTLIKIIHTTGQGLRLPAIQALREIKDVGAIPILLRSIQSIRKNETIATQSAIVAALSKMDRMDAIEDRKEIIGNIRYAGRKIAAVKALIRLKYFKEPILISVISDDKDVRSAAFSTILELDVSDVMELLLICYERKIEDTFKVIKKLDRNRVVSELIEYAKDRNSEYRIESVKLLMELKAKKAISDLLPLIYDSDKGLAQAAIYALIGLGAKNRIPKELHPPQNEFSFRLFWKKNISQGWQSFMNGVSEFADDFKNNLSKIWDSIGIVRSLKWWLSTNYHKLRYAYVPPRVILKLSSGLKNKNPDIQLATIDEIRRRRIRLLAPALIRLLKASDIEVRKQAIHTLGRIESSRAIPHLIRLMQNEQEIIRVSTLEALNELGLDKELHFLLQFLDRHYESFNIPAKKILVQSSQRNIKRDLISLFLASDTASKNEVIAIITPSNSKLFSAKLLQLMNDPIVGTRIAAMKKLQELQIKGVIPQLIKNLDIRSGKELKLTIATLVEFGAKEASPHLLDLLSRKTPALREQIIQALESFNEQEALIQRLLQLAKQDSSIQVLTIDTFSKIKSKAAIEGLIELSQLENKQLRYNCVQALGEIGQGQAIPRLKELLSDKASINYNIKNRICDAAYHALDLIGTQEAKRIMDEWKANEA